MMHGCFFIFLFLFLFLFLPYSWMSEGNDAVTFLSIRNIPSQNYIRNILTFLQLQQQGCSLRGITIPILYVGIPIASNNIRIVMVFSHIPTVATLLHIPMPEQQTESYIHVHRIYGVLTRHFENIGIRQHVMLYAYL